MHVRLTSFAAARSAIQSVRDAVFGQEQNVPREKDWDGRDEACVHAVAFEAAGQAVGTGRLQPDGRVGRLAVLKAWRGQGIGSALLEALLGAARERGLAPVYLHSQLHAVPFYEKAGFRAEGAVFEEAGIPHVHMVRADGPAAEPARAARRPPFGFVPREEAGYRESLPGIRQKTLAFGSQTLMVEFRLQRGAELPLHRHPHEQTGYLVSGQLDMMIGEEARTQSPGDSWCIPGHVQHRATAAEDSVAIEVFSPVREDYLP